MSCSLFPVDQARPKAQILLINLPLLYNLLFLVWNIFQLVILFTVLLTILLHPRVNTSIIVVDYQVTGRDLLENTQSIIK